MGKKSTSVAVRQLTAFASEAGSSGDPMPVRALFPVGVSDASGFAALIEAAAIDAGIEFKSLIKQIESAAPPKMSLIIRRHWDAEPPDLREGGPKRWQRSSKRPGPKPRDWSKDYGKSSASLGLAATVRRTLDPSMTWMAALRATLLSARKDAGKHARPDETIKNDARELKQAVRAR